MNQPSAVIEELGAAYLDLFGTWSPINATSQGIPGYDHRVPDVSEEAQQDVAHRMTAIRDRAAAIDPDPLDETDRGSRGALIHATQAVIDTINSREVEWAIGGVGLGPIYTVLALVGKFDADTDVRARAYLDRCDGLPHYLDQSAKRLRAGARAGTVANHRAVASAIDQLERYLATTTASDPLLQLLPQVADDEVRGRIETSVTTRVRPAMRRLLDVVRDDLLPVARADDLCGLAHMPGGKAIYARAIAVHTTTELTAHELHRTGRELGDELREELCGMARSELGTTDFELVQQRLRDDVSLRYNSSDEILRDVRATLARAEAAAPRWFGRRYDVACDVVAIPDDEARVAPVGQYRPPAADGTRGGQYWVNASRPETRARHEYEAVSFHESVPGHHLQLAVAQGLSGLPDFRRFLYVTAYGEGWGLYAERLADEMGLYSNDLARMGMVALDMWRAARLVVDTGVHALGWSRSQAIAYMHANTVTPAATIVSEVDRYICWPGQALAYMVGRLEIMRMRTRARSVLRDRFDISQFHDVVLGGGSLPLTQVADAVERWTVEAAGRAS